MIEIEVTLNDEIFEQLTDREHDEFLSTTVVNEAVSAATDLVQEVTSLDCATPGIILCLAVLSHGLGRELLGHLVPDHERGDVIFAAIQKAACTIHDAMVAKEGKNPPRLN